MSQGNFSKPTFERLNVQTFLHLLTLSFFPLPDSPAFLPGYRARDIHRSYDAAAAALPDKRQHQARGLRWLGPVRGPADPALDRGHGWHEEPHSRSPATPSPRHVCDKRGRLPDLLQ